MFGPSLRLPPGAKVVAGARQPPTAFTEVVHQTLELHVHDGGFCIAGPLVVDRELLDECGQNVSGDGGPGMAICRINHGVNDIHSRHEWQRSATPA